MSDERKIEKELINYLVNRGNKYNQVKNGRELRKMGTESRLAELKKWEIEGVVIYSSDFRVIELYKIYSRINKIRPLKNPLTPRNYHHSCKEDQKYIFTKFRNYS